MTPGERAFTGQSERFVEKAIQTLGVSTLRDAPRWTGRPPTPLEPTIIQDYRHLREAEIVALKAAYFGCHAVAPFIVLNSDKSPDEMHPLVTIVAQLADDLELRYPLGYPFLTKDGTWKIREPPRPFEPETRQDNSFRPHCDGLGYAGTLKAVGFYMDSAPLCGGYTYFQNVIRLGLDLAQENPEAFRDLFLPDAMTITVASGKKTIRVTSPILFLNDQGDPQTAFRVSSQGYEVAFRRDRPKLKFAVQFLEELTRPFSEGSCFLQFAARGHGCFFRNQLLAHGRTPYLDGPESHQQRVLARIWFMSAAHHAKYRNAPGTYVMDEYAALFPEHFGLDVLDGEWCFEPHSGRNLRIR